MENYTIYHLHSDLSTGVTSIDSVTKPAQYIARAKECGMKALAFSEHGSVFSWVKKKQAIEAAGMKYIHAEEFYLTETIDTKIKDNYHIVIIAKNYNGVLELNHLSSLAFCRTDGHYYYVPRITIDELEQTSDNLMITSACLASPLSKGNDGIKQRFLDFMIAHKDRCYLEIQHHSVEDQKTYNQWLYTVSQEYGIPLIAGTDTHALNAEHAEARIVLQKSKNIRFADEETWDLTFKTYDELIHAYEIQDALPMDVVREAIANTNAMADRVEEFTLDKSYKYPALWDNPKKVFIKKIKEGIKRRGVDKYPNRDEYAKRIEYEIQAYEHNGAFDFMLLMEDIISWCRSSDIPIGYGRGSVNGSVCAWLLGITEMDAIKHNLNFDRFMNVERVSLSDIDTDFPPNRIDEVKQYVFNHHGLYCSDIITFNTIADKGAIRDVCRALYKDTNDDYMRITDDALALFERSEDDARAKYPEVFKYVDICKGVVVSIGSHPCLVAGTKVLTKEGYKNIEDIIVGDYVLTHNNRFMPVCDVMQHKASDLTKLTAKGCFDIICTQNHPFLARRRIRKQYRVQPGDNFGAAEWIDASSLQKGDAIAIPVNHDSVMLFDSKQYKLPFHNPDFWWIVGRYIGDGYCVSVQRGPKWIQNNIYICHGYNDPTAIDIYTKLKSCNVNYTTCDKRTAKEIIFKAESRDRWWDFLQLFGKYAHRKKLPTEIYSLPTELLNSFLDGYFSADGYNNGKQIECATASYELALGLSRCINKVYKTICSLDIKKAHTEIIENRLVNVKPSYRVRFTINPKNKYFFTDDSYIWTYVDTVENYTDSVDVYNLAVLNDNSYTVANVAVHNCGLVVAPYPIDNKMGLCTTSTDPLPVSQIYMKEIDGLNYVKLDLLKLDTIQLIHDTCKAANIDMLTPDNTDINDVNVWNSIRDNTVGIFQWEGATGDGYIKKLMSDENISKLKSSVGDVDRMTLLTIGNSAIRPAGASYRDDLASGVIRKSGSAAIDDFLKPTFGYLVFQCQIIEFLHSYCGFTMGEADIVRRCFAKKLGTEAWLPIIKNGGTSLGGNQRYIPGFINTMKEKYDMSVAEAEQTITSFLKVIEDASDYLFSVNHSTPYSYEGYVCGWLRYHYPLQFLTCALNICKDNEEKTLALISYAKEHGIKLMPPKFGFSKNDYEFDIDTNAIYKGLSSVKFLGDNVSEELDKLSGDQHDDFVDLLVALQSTSINSKQLKILINIGFFDKFGGINELLREYVIFDSLYGRKQLKVKDLDSNGVPQWLAEKHSTKHTEKTIYFDNTISLIKDIIANTEHLTNSIIDQIRGEVINLGCGLSTAEVGADWYCIQNISGFSNNVFTLYQMRFGVTETYKFDYKCRGGLVVGDVIKINKIEHRHKRRKIADTENMTFKWVEIDDMEDVVTSIKKSHLTKLSDNSIIQS